MYPIEDRRKGYYSVIQYTHMFEAINVGLVIIYEDNGEIVNECKIRKELLNYVFPLTQIENKEAEIRNVSYAIETIKKEDPIKRMGELEKFISTRANAIQLTPLKMLYITKGRRTFEDILNSFCP